MSCVMVWYAYLPEKKKALEMWVEYMNKILDLS